ncbi:hypothetical protein JCGZ_12732 [Jatropha curcas]|uniref:Zinc finger GRF-type domain-containing protein n=1 Tax=Jatropha curcas TaxID=180498 RepID=A0A067KLT7_JATCU|nr:hypothetical protein JCGZ_12732 [Jatropha curcas]
MSVSSAGDNPWEGRFVNWYCKCGKKASIRISETRDKHRLYYNCVDNVCGSFLGMSDCSQRMENSYNEVRQRSIPASVNDMKEDSLLLQSEIRRIAWRLEHIEAELGSLKMIFGVFMMGIMMLFVILVIVVCKAK